MKPRLKLSFVKQKTKQHKSYMFSQDTDFHCKTLQVSLQSNIVVLFLCLFALIMCSFMRLFLPLLPTQKP